MPSARTIDRAGRIVAPYEREPEATTPDGRDVSVAQPARRACWTSQTKQHPRARLPDHQKGVHEPFRDRIDHSVRSRTPSSRASRPGRVRWTDRLDRGIGPFVSPTDVAVTDCATGIAPGRAATSTSRRSGQGWRKTDETRSAAAHEGSFCARRRRWARSHGHGSSLPTADASRCATRDGSRIVVAGKVNTRRRPHSGPTEASQLGLGGVPLRSLISLRLRRRADITTARSCGAARSRLRLPRVYDTPIEIGPSKLEQRRPACFRLDGAAVASRRLGTFPASRGRRQGDGSGSRGR